MAVTKESVVEASIRILGREGAEGLSMRAIAKEMDIKAASLYWHFEGKREMYGAISEYMCSRCAMPDDALPPQAYLEEACKSYHEMLLSVRDSTAVFEESMPTTRSRAAIIRKMAEKLMDLGVKKDSLMTISNMLNNYVLSFTADEVRIKNTPAEAMQAFQDMLDPLGTSIPLGVDGFEEQFLYGLRVLFAGISAYKG